MSIVRWNKKYTLKDILISYEEKTSDKKKGLMLKKFGIFILYSFVAVSIFVLTAYIFGTVEGIILSIGILSILKSVLEKRRTLKLLKANRIKLIKENREKLKIIENYEKHIRYMPIFTMSNLIIFLSVFMAILLYQNRLIVFLNSSKGIVMTYIVEMLFFYTIYSEYSLYKKIKKEVLYEIQKDFM